MTSILRIDGADVDPAPENYISDYFVHTHSRLEKQLSINTKSAVNPLEPSETAIYILLTHIDLPLDTHGYTN